MRSSSLTLCVLACIGLLLLACSKPPATVEFVRYKAEADVPRINVQDAKAAVDQGEAVIVDSRPDDAYRMEHIAGAINVPLGTGAEGKFASLPTGKKIIVYCS